MKKPYTLGPGSQKVYEYGLHTDCLLIIDAALEAAPIDFTLVSGKRTAQEQHDLFKIGRTYVFEVGPMSDPKAWVENGKGVVTYADGYVIESKHQTGEAFDFQAHVPGHPELNYNKIHMAVLIGSFLTLADSLFNERMISHRLRSGADWNMDTQYLEPGTFQDAPHLELIDP